MPTGLFFSGVSPSHNLLLGAERLGGSKCWAENNTSYLEKSMFHTNTLPLLQDGWWQEGWDKAPWNEGSNTSRLHNSAACWMYLTQPANMWPSPIKSVLTLLSPAVCAKYIHLETSSAEAHCSSEQAVQECYVADHYIPTLNCCIFSVSYTHLTLPTNHRV